mgnify:CR=1 FL=1
MAPVKFLTIQILNSIGLIKYHNACIQNVGSAIKTNTPVKNAKPIKTKINVITLPVVEIGSEEVSQNKSTPARYTSKLYIIRKIYAMNDISRYDKKVYKKTFPKFLNNSNIFVITIYTLFLIRIKTLEDINNLIAINMAKFSFSQ